MFINSIEKVGRDLRVLALKEVISNLEEVMQGNLGIFEWYEITNKELNIIEKQNEIYSENSKMF